MTQEEQLELIKENSYMKYCICLLIEKLDDKNDKNLIKFLEQTINIKKEQNFAEKYYEKYGKESDK